MRSTVRQWLEAIDLDRDTQDDLVLAVNEAASNVVDHAYSRKTADDTVGLAFWVKRRDGLY